MLKKFMWLWIAGGLGTIARYSLAGFTHRFVDGMFPWGTLLVNTAGCMLAGAIWALSEYHASISAEVRTIILIGFFGAFTTFSSFILETSQLFRMSEYAAAMKNVVLNNAIGAIALVAGIFIIKFAKGGA